MSHTQENYIAGWNMPGYMPDSEPSAFETFDEAKRYIIEELKRCEDEADAEAVAEYYCARAEDINLESDCFSVRVGFYVWWVAKP